MNNTYSAARRHLAIALFALCIVAPAWAQQPGADSDPGPSAERAPAVSNEVPGPAPAEPIPAPKKKEDINFFVLLTMGGIYMWPILGMSIIAVTMAIERAINLRRMRIMPPGLISALGQLGNSSGGFDPRKAYRICQQYPSTAATVIRAMLLKIGRPHSEVEHAVAETCQRETDRLYANIRWLNLAVAVTPLIGLLGTIWGLIICFHDATYVDDTQNRATVFAEGIYVALVTTLGGLMVAIPSAVVAHMLEGRLQSLMSQVEEMVFNLMPQIERFEGRVRFTRHKDDEEPGNGDMGVAAVEARVK